MPDPTNKFSQLWAAAVISVIYALVMVAVVVAILLQTTEDGWFSPSTIFLIMVLGQMAVAALMHPREIICFFYIVFYYMAIPSMYLLLVLYAIINLNNVAWGTREVQVKMTRGVITHSYNVIIK